LYFLNFILTPPTAGALTYGKLTKVLYCKSVINAKAIQSDLNIFAQMSRVFKIGDKVSFLNEKGKGTVTNIINDHRVLVTNEDGFEIPYSTNQLVPLVQKSSYDTSAKMNAKWMEGKEDEEMKPPKLFDDEVWEVDLHLHELIDQYDKKSDYEKLQIQLKYFRKCMDTAIAHRVRKIIFIHGVGKGTLRQEIVHALKSYDRIQYFDAPFRKYGYGALTVEFGGF
jgi:dsDNA-specific endonuclease/ATPase MutS2